MTISKGEMYTDKGDGRDLVVTQVENLPGGQYVEFLEVNPLGHFVGFAAEDLSLYDIEPKFQRTDEDTGL